MSSVYRQVRDSSAVECLSNVKFWPGGLGFNSHEADEGIFDGTVCTGHWAACSWTSQEC